MEYLRPEPYIFRMHPDKPDSGWSLVLVSPGDHEGRVWITYIQFPERGEPSGGHSGEWSFEKNISEPRTVSQVMSAHRYMTAKRVIDLRAELAGAEADRDAVERTYDLLRGKPR